MCHVPSPFTSSKFPYTYMQSFPYNAGAHWCTQVCIFIISRDYHYNHHHVRYVVYDIFSSGLLLLRLPFRLKKALFLFTQEDVCIIARSSNSHGRLLPLIGSITNPLYNV